MQAWFLIPLLQSIASRHWIDHDVHATDEVHRIAGDDQGTSEEPSPGMLPGPDYSLGAVTPCLHVRPPAIAVGETSQLGGPACTTHVAGRIGDASRYSATRTGSCRACSTMPADVCAAEDWRSVRLGTLPRCQ